MEGEASEEMVAMLHAQCQQAEAVVKAQKNNHLAYSAWGHCLIQLALTQKTNEEKLDYLSRSREKLEKAIAIDCNTTTPDDKLTYFLVIHPPRHTVLCMLSGQQHRSIHMLMIFTCTPCPVAARR
jgi:hypothetical protein